MKFSDAIKSGFENTINFKGRASRAEYVLWYLFRMLLAIACSIVDVAINSDGAVSAIVALALVLPSLSLMVRRLHDIGISGLWFFGLNAAVVLVICLFFYTDIALLFSSFFSPSIMANFLLIFIIYLLLLLMMADFVLFFILLFKKSGGPNKYGPPPLD